MDFGRFINPAGGSLEFLPTLEKVWHILPQFLNRLVNSNILLKFVQQKLLKLKSENRIWY